MIPKINNPKTISSFRPITLCNVLYKVVIKVNVNRIRPILRRIVCLALTLAQASFILDRQTLDNISIIQEIVYNLEKKKGKEGGIIFKSDIEKAYDRIS